MQNADGGSGEFVTLSIRLIRSFEHRNLRFFPLHHVDLDWTTEQLINVIKGKIQESSSLPPPFKKFEFDTLKVSFISHFMPISGRNLYYFAD